MIRKGKDKEPIFKGENIICLCESYEETTGRGKFCECILRDRDFKFIAKLEGEKLIMHPPSYLKPELKEKLEEKVNKLTAHAIADLESEGYDEEVILEAIKRFYPPLLYRFADRCIDGREIDLGCLQRFEYEIEKLIQQ